RSIIEGRLGMAANPSFIFIAGAEGSGTTLLSRLIASPGDSASLGGLHVKLPPHPEAKRLVDEFQAANRSAWDRMLSFAEARDARRRWQKAWKAVCDAEAFDAIKHFVFKRSFPFGTPRGQFVPYLPDVLDLAENAYFALAYREPCASTFSN